MQNYLIMFISLKITCTIFWLRNEMVYFSSMALFSYFYINNHYHIHHFNLPVQNILIEMKGLTHWGRIMYKYIGNVTIIGSDNDFSFKKMSFAKWRPFCLGLNVLNMYNACHKTLSDKGGMTIENPDFPEVLAVKTYWHLYRQTLVILLLN